MSYSLIDRATVLNEALPYIQRFNNKTVVVKYGGNAMVSDELRAAVISDIVLLSLVGIRVVVVHGGGPEINEMLDRVGKESKFVNGLRYTDQETMDIVQMVLCGKLNKELVSRIIDLGGKAMGLCGIDGGMIKAVQLSEEYGLVGEITDINTEPITAALENGYIPVISTVAQAADHSGSYNINADTAASKIAAALEAEKIILLTDIRGLLRDVNDENSLINVVRASEVPALVKEGIIKGGMIPKLECCVEAVRSGVKSAHIIDGRIKHSILIELLSDSGVGTMIH